MSTEEIHVEKVTPHIGAEISGIDLRQPLSEQSLRIVKDALFENQVIFFRDQPMTLDQQIRFAQHFGELYAHPAAAAERAAGKAAKLAAADEKAPANPYVSSVAGYPEVIRIYADADSKQIAGETWHSDVTSEAQPPMGAILRVEELPDVGGDTLFASMYAAFDALSEPMKKFLCGMTAIHDGVKVYGGRSAYDPTKKYPRSEHPVVRTHPVTGRQALFVSTQFTTRITQLSQGESDALLQYLFRHLEQPMFQCRFRWRKNSIAFWDNRCTQHQAQWDYYPQRRVGYRVQLVGDRPFFRP